MTNNFEHLNNDEFEEIKKVFFAQSYEITDELQDLALKLEAEPGDSETLKAIQRHLHTLKGDSSSLGITALSTLCHKVEDVLTSLRDRTRQIDSEAIALLLRSIDFIENILRVSESGENVEDINEAVEAIDSFTNSGSTMENVKAEHPHTEYTEYQILQIEEAVKRGKKLYKAEIGFHPLCAEKSVAAFMLSQRLNSIGEIIISEPDITGDEVEKSEKVSIVFTTDIDADEVKEKLFITGITGEVNVRSLESQKSASPASLPAPLSEAWPGSEAGEVVNQKPENKRLEHSISENSEIKTTNSRSEMLRVEVSKVDWIINLVGELIIGRSIIDQIAKDAEEGESTANISARLFSVNSYMERTVSDLQKGMMKMRMVPINHVFRKFPTIIRELAAENGKKVILETYGRDTELDKGIVDALGEPLVHIIRNSIDHGIEDPAYRRSAGKNEEGTITLRAYHEAARIVIEISDDGRGIDTAKLKEKAIEKGFLSSNDFENLSASEAIRLIFLSGLSTSETISDISGRGIGMDAVKIAIENMKGTIEVKSTPGKGTKFTMRLPLTLAVIKALLVEVSQRLYAIPISAIAEVTRIMMENLTTVDGRDTLILRERIISIINLRELFRTNGNNPPSPPFSKGGNFLTPPLEKGDIGGFSDEKGDKKKFILILGIGNKKVGLVVDRLIGQQELVIKAVDAEYGGSELVAGASILGNGRVVLILDAPSIFKKAIEDEKKRMVEA